MTLETHGLLNRYNKKIYGRYQYHLPLNIRWSVHHTKQITKVQCQHHYFGCDRKVTLFAIRPTMSVQKIYRIDIFGHVILVMIIEILFLQKAVIHVKLEWNETDVLSSILLK